LIRQALLDFTELELTRCRGYVHAQWRLAAELGAPLATFDERLGAAARQWLGGG
jgi:hypothetical protein